MSILSSPSTGRRLPRRLRWAAPAVALVGAVAVAGGLPGGSASADEHPALPARTAAQLLSQLQGVQVSGLSGTVVQTSRLGLPELPGATGDATLSLQSFASGSRTLRVWADGPERQRVALLGQLAESDVVRSGRDVWTYSSSTREVTHLVLPTPDAQAPDATPQLTTPQLTTPQQAADAALAAIDPTTAVTVDTTARVAGRPAYQLVLAPRDTRSLVGRVQLALDSATSLPLRVQVFARGSASPALEVGFTSLSLTTPDRDVFSFTPPKGSAVTERALPDAPATRTPEPAPATSDGARVLGSGWTSVLVVAPSPATTAALDDPTVAQLTTAVPGGRLVTSALVSVLLADDGTVYVGAVRGTDLQRVAATGTGL